MTIELKRGDIWERAGYPDMRVLIAEKKQNRGKRLVAVYDDGSRMIENRLGLLSTLISRGYAYAGKCKGFRMELPQ